MNYFYRLHEDEVNEQADRQTLAVLQAVSSAFSGKPPILLSSFFQRDSAALTPTSRDFPHDVTYLPEDGLAQLQDWRGGTWPAARLAAYQGQDVLAKRAAVTTFLWERYSENPRMSRDLLRLWAELEPVDECLRGVPSWFTTQHPANTAAAWEAWFAPNREAAIRRHQELMQKIMALK